MLRTRKTKGELLVGLEAMVRQHTEQLRRDCQEKMDPSNYVEAAKRHRNDGRLMAYSNILRYIITNGGV